MNNQKPGQVLYLINTLGQAGESQSSKCGLIAEFIKGQAEGIPVFITNLTLNLKLA